MAESPDGQTPYLAPYRATDAAAAFTEERHLAILSTPGPHGAIHSVAVGFTLSEGVVRIITSDGTQKVRNVERSGSATVAQVDGRRWLSLAGRASIRREPDEVSRAVELYAQRYRQPSPNPKRVVIEILVDDVIGSPGMKG
ncbi:TIGR03618 family F420-dependent PPOX class oxidoreductase [Lacisediminihabitans changchengi]|uniref:TIGR03618 family F420-dependent PPOX class oxidoreductase n=1 Tax=Lacisediminihabitans changchengi TaxID=2787634 RepID=UPI0027DDED5D|nr:TIGR03618 family F420-dependent PPOX class oxidoreductase [Lacisediminihabitans changchengi]